jgi:hypothetical protein
MISRYAAARLGSGLAQHVHDVAQRLARLLPKSDGTQETKKPAQRWLSFRPAPQLEPEA